MWLILQYDKPVDFVIATGVQHTVREFATLAFHDVGIEQEWQGESEPRRISSKSYSQVVLIFKNLRIREIVRSCMII